MVAFDVAAALVEFLTDPSRTSLELPHMTTGQRKSTKKLVEQYPELQCESYGFGAERQLHLFKKCSLEAGKDVNASVEDACSKNASDEGIGENSSPDCTPTSHADGFEEADWGKVQVRNTFIHIKNMETDQRVVQSMPHGMFKQCLLAESCCQAPIDAAPVSEPESEPACPPSEDTHAKHCAHFGLGSLVVVQGLTKLPAFNGLSAVVQSWDEPSGRYSIMLVSAEGGCQQAKVKHENLRLLMPCP